ncbi:MAG: diamine N-acetyltransferase [Crocinitomix sp.]|jgi:diamine N-acetyltransferase
MLKGSSIYLRTLEPTDAETLLDWENNPENWRVSETRVPFSKQLIHDYVNSAQDIFAVKQIRLMICLLDTDEAIGSVDLFDYEPIHQRMGLGILIVKSMRGKGYGLEALSVAANYALNGVGIRNLYCSILGDNAASRKLFERAGFVEIGCRKDWFNDKGHWVDEYLYQKQLV